MKKTYFKGLKYPNNLYPGVFSPIGPFTLDEDMPLPCVEAGITVNTIIYPDNNCIYKNIGNTVFKVTSIYEGVRVTPGNPYRVIGITRIYINSQETWELVCEEVKDSVNMGFEEDIHGVGWIWVTVNGSISTSWGTNCGISYSEWYISIQNDDLAEIFGIHSIDKTIQVMVEFEKMLDKFEEEFNLVSRGEFL